VTPAQQCKKLGITLQQVSDKTNTSRQTLTNWHKNKPLLFEVVLKGVLYSERLNKQREREE